VNTPRVSIRGINEINAASQANGSGITAKLGGGLLNSS